MVIDKRGPARPSCLHVFCFSVVIVEKISCALFIEWLLSDFDLALEGHNKRLSCYLPRGGNYFLSVDVT